MSDGGVWNKCGMSKATENGSLSLPPPKCLPMGVRKVPYVFVGDDAFALKTIPYEALSPAWTRPGEEGLQLST